MMPNFLLEFLFGLIIVITLAYGVVVILFPAFTLALAVVALLSTFAIKKIPTANSSWRTAHAVVLTVLYLGGFITLFMSLLVIFARYARIVV